VACHQRGRRHRRASALACVGRWLECGKTHVDEAGTHGQLFQWWHGHLARWLACDAAAAPHEQRRPWSEMANEELKMEKEILLRTTL
jgi:hypothetical protein